MLDLSQSLATASGANYTISFWLAQSPTPIAPYLNSFSLAFGTTSTISLAQVASSAYTLYSVTALATGTLTPLTFGFRDDTGFFSIDDITVTPAAVPEPATVGLGAFAAMLLGLASRLLLGPYSPKSLHAPV